MRAAGVMIGVLLMAGEAAAVAGGGLFNCGGYPRRGEYGRDDPLVTGCELLFEWRELEPEPGRYDWAVVDAAMAPWTDAGKVVALRVMTACNDRNATPGWVFEAGAPHIDAASFTASSNVVYPVFWNPIFVARWSAFVAAFADRYDGHPQVEFVQVGGVGRWEETYVCAENIPMGRAWVEAGYTHDAYIDHVCAMVDLFKARFTRTPVLLSISIGGPDPALRDPAVVGEETAEYAVRRGLYLKQNGLTAYYSYTDHDHFPAIFHRMHRRTKLAYEQGAPTTNSWVGPVGPFESIVYRALIDPIDYLWIYDEDLRQPAHRAMLEFAARHLGNESVREMGDLFIRFERMEREYADPAVVLTQDDICFGIFHSGGWVEPLPGSDLTPDVKDGVPCKSTSADNPFVILDLDDNVLRAESDGRFRFDRVTVEIDYFDEGRGVFALLFGHDGNRWTGRADFEKTGTHRWLTARVVLEEVRFPKPERSQRERDLALYSPDGADAFREVRVRLGE